MIENEMSLSQNGFITIHEHMTSGKLLKKLFKKYGVYHHFTFLSCFSELLTFMDERSENKVAFSFKFSRMDDWKPRVHKFGIGDACVSRSTFTSKIS